MSSAYTASPKALPNEQAPLQVKCASRHFTVHIGTGLLEWTGQSVREASFAGKARACALIADSHVEKLYGARVLESLRDAGLNPVLAKVPAGEQSKSLAEAGRIADLMITAGLDRYSLVVALGGGVVGDLAGFVASIYYRGVPLVSLPTTVVSQVDSAIGGKTGVNSALGKNLLGTFHQPSLVLADVGTLATLGTREFNEGFAEIIKHGVIRDRSLLAAVERFGRADTAAMTAIVRRNLEIKAAIVAEDEYERTGLRALLNFGHTIGHAIEQAAGYGRLLHGEAISLGMVAALRLSVEKAGLPAADFRYVIERLHQFGLPTQLPADIETHAIMQSLARDKKFESGAIRFVLTGALGTAYLSEPGQVSAPDLERAVSALREPVSLV